MCVCVCVCVCVCARHKININNNNDRLSTWTFDYLQKPFWRARSSSVGEFSSWCDGLYNRPLMVDPFSYISLQPVLHDWSNKGCEMCNPICGSEHVTDPLLLIRKSGPCGGSGVLLSPSEWPLPYVRLHVTRK